MSGPIWIPPGTHIDHAATLLVEAARASADGEAWATFNGIDIRACGSSDSAEIVRQWRAESDRQDEAYRQSPEGRAAAARSAAEVEELQERHDALVHELASIHPADHVALLDWLCRLQPCSDRVGVRVDSDTIVKVLEQAGYRANANVGPAYRPDDRENVFRYLVGQALDGLKNGPAIHPILLKFAAEWRERFEAPLPRSLGRWG
ncbi:hypothetical protein [Enterovirga aerilata]|uniref:Uncharacterized protein n=1 Tax=Enterovirga aerilata TaxID=2730920 RepID=A0A849ICG6_9HYPH|nr:hypothetical protein [Enterovirga sp. DB1703]NNM75098.1 hypothetical protein [Enterovirga sp. DB1703]